MVNDSILIVVDAQVGLFRGPERVVGDGKIITTINKLIEKSRNLGVPVLFIHPAYLDKEWADYYIEAPKYKFPKLDRKYLKYNFQESGRRLLSENELNIDLN